MPKKVKTKKPNHIVDTHEKVVAKIKSILSDNYPVAGQYCKCHAIGERDCGCDADWTTPEERMVKLIRKVLGE